MARIDVLPSIEIIRGFKGILDFYLWRGLPCVRAWPQWRPARQTDASKAAALFFGAVVKSYSLLGEIALSAYKQDAADQPRTARDIFVSGVYGHLHEADMSDFLTLLVECRDFLSALTALLGALDSIDTDELVVNVDQTVLPPLAATSTSQASALTALQKIDDLQDALESKALDRLLVRGMDQLFSFLGVLALSESSVISGAGGWANSDACPAGQIWIVTNVFAYDRTSPTTRHDYQLFHNGSGIPFASRTAAFAAFDTSEYSGWQWLDPGDAIRIYFIGALAADDIDIHITGYRMTLET